MAFRGRWTILAVGALVALLSVSCARKKDGAGKAAADSTAADSTLSYVSDEVSFGVFFDEEGTKRTAEIKGGKEAKLYVIISLPTTMQIRAAEWRLALPEGVVVQNDRFFEGRVAVLGTFEDGISETWGGDCVTGPKMLLHVLTVTVPDGLTNGEIAIMPSLQSNFLGVAECEENMPLVRASAYKAVINPTE